MMQSHPLLPPKIRRQESLHHGRRVFLFASITFVVLTGLALFYFSTSSGVPETEKAGDSHTSFELSAPSSSTGESTKLASQKEESSGELVKIEVNQPELLKQEEDESSKEETQPAGEASSNESSEASESTSTEASPSEESEQSTPSATSGQSSEDEEDEEKTEAKKTSRKSSRKEMRKKSGKASKSKSKAKADEDDEIAIEESSPTDGKPVSAFSVCDQSLSEVVPCLERKIHKKMKLRLTTKLMEHYERHCPSSEYRVRCLVPPPPGYKAPIRWPSSRDEVWVANVPHTFLATEKSDQHWMVVEGDKIKFPGGGTHFHNGADKYIEGLGRMLGEASGDLSLGGRIRTVLDVGCGVASFGGYLLAQNILAMSVAPNDVHQNQIQFALERGIPAWLGVLGTQRLPFPSMSFELAHCSRCRIDWAQRDGLLLAELDRVLRPGGYWAWSAPPAYRNDANSKKIWQEVTTVTKRLCWTIAAHEGQTVIFQKPLDNTCYESRSAKAKPPMCTKAEPNPDGAWYTTLTNCINQAPNEYKLEAWPERTLALPPRLPDMVNEAYEMDTTAWKARVADYLRRLGEALPEIVEDKNSFRNVMDMNANIGGFGVVLTKARPVWVMNVAPPDSNTLSTVYDRGMLGIYHYWCEEFSTYPRTYDLLHAWKVVSAVSGNGCSVDDFLLEADRIIRPLGFIIFRDTPELIATVQKRVDALRWEVVSPAALAKEDALSDGAENILIVRKTLWENTPVDKE